MKIIEALKKKKDLLRKADDLKTKVGQHCVHMSFETPTYQDQKGQIKEWIQAHSDVLKEIEHLGVAIQRTNLETQVSIDLNGNTVTKPITAWILRRRELAKNELGCWSALGDKGLREGIIKDSQDQKVEAKIVRCYDPEERDKKMELYRTEPTTIDTTLETVNAVTDLITDEA